jgi:hypothetical protein
MRLLTEDAVVICNHVLGRVGIRPAQGWVRIDGRRVLVDDDPEGRPISGCPNVGATIKPCQRTLRVQVGYSDWVRIEGKGVCLDTVSGLTDGTPPGTVHYRVQSPGQDLVSEVA